MSTTPTLRDAERVVDLLWHALVDLVESTRGTMPKHLFIQCSEATGEAKKLRAALTQGAGAVEPVAPAAWWIEKAEQFALPSKDGTRPFDRNWQPLYTAQQLLQAVARALEELKFHPQASHVEPNYRDWFNKTIDAAIRAKGTHD